MFALSSNEQGKCWNRSRTLDELLPTAWKEQGLRIINIAAADLNGDGHPGISVSASNSSCPVMAQSLASIADTA